MTDFTIKTITTKNSEGPNSGKRIPFAAEAILAGSIALGLLVATLSPTTVLSDFPILASFTDFIASLIPGIDKIARVSRFPEVTRFTSAVLWASVPLQAVIFSYPGVMVFRLEMIKQKKLLALICWLFLPLFVLMPIVGSIGVPTPEKLGEKNLYAWGLRSVSESRLWLGVIGGAVTSISAMFIFGFITWWPRTWAIYFKPKN